MWQNVWLQWRVHPGRKSIPQHAALGSPHLAAADARVSAANHLLDRHRRVGWHIRQIDERGGGQLVAQPLDAARQGITQQHRARRARGEYARSSASPTPPGGKRARQGDAQARALGRHIQRPVTWSASHFLDSRYIGGILTTRIGRIHLDY